MIPINSVTVLGAGTMGAQIALHCANAGIPALLLDLTAAVAREGLERARRLKPDPQFTPDVHRLVTTAGFDEGMPRLKDADWIMEAVVERLGRDRDLAVVFQVELRQSVKFMERFSETFLQDYFKLIRQAIADGQQDGAFRKDISATTATKIFFGALDEMATNWVLSRRKYDLNAEADAVVSLFIHGVQR